MKYVDLKKVFRMDRLITHKNTGNPEQFAKRLELSRSAFYQYLAYMRDELQLEIGYNYYNETYYYKGNDFCSLIGDMRCEMCKEAWRCNRT